MNREQADIVVADLGRHLGIAGLALDESGMGILALEDGALVIAIGHNPRRGSIELMTCLADVEPSPARSLAALRGNFGLEKPGCETIGVDPASGAFVLQRRYLGQDLVEGGLIGALEGLVDNAKAWTRRLLAIHGGVADRKSAPPTGVLASGAVRA